jgi:two-component system cell cycle sensor histidine kinase/response regulator CckA
MRMLSTEQLLSLVNGLGAIVWEAEPETFRFTFVSEEAERILGYPAQDWLDDPDFRVHHTHPDDVDRCATFCREATRRGEDHQFEYRMHAADGRIVWLRDIVSVRPAKGGGRRLAGISLDITSEKQAQADKHRLEATQEQLAEAMKMEAVGRLAGGVAHDFNNLLTVIAGYAELVSATLNTPDFHAEDLDEIKRAAHRASLLTRQLLAFGRKQVLRPEVLDINVVVREVGRLVSRLIGEDIELVLETTSAPLPVFGDRSQVDQVLMNLAVNARDAMPTGGRLIIRTEGNESTVFLIVTDTGIGMSPQLLEYIFEPFFTTKEVGKGTGLGLSTAYGIVKQSKGDIKVQSEVNKGTVFTISLPRVCEPHPVGARGTAGKPPGGETILLVEDDAQVRDLVEQALLRLGYDVLTAADGGAAIDLCQRYQGKISLLITDIVMAQASGPQVYAQVAALVPDVAVLYMSGYTGETILARGGREEGVAYLQKPFTQATLARKVREVLDEALRPQAG